MRKRKGNKIVAYISRCECPNCKNTFPIPRLPHQARERGHKKDIWCPFCQKRVTMTEYRYGDAYMNAYGERLV
jgi:uncharacterized CHY-type Zn-finger protein